MCVIVHQPAGSYLAKPTAKAMWERNPDGAGFAYINSLGNIIVRKAMKFDEFWKEFETHRSANRDKDFLVHFRIATSGKVGIDNTHPFKVDEHTVMAHNGMLNHIVGNISIHAELSDTREFVNEVLPNLPETWLDNVVLREMVADYIGASKLMFLTTNPALKENVYIINREYGTDKHKMWWSNTAHERVYGTTKKGDTNTYSRGFTVRPKGKPADSAATTVKYDRPSEDNIYQLPLPRDTEDACEAGVTPVTQEEMEAFWLNSEWKDVTTYRTLPDETDEPLLALKALRREAGLDGAIGQDVLTGEYECQVCYEQISETNGDCGCWDLICIGCGNLAPYCLHDPEDAELHKVNEAWRAYEEKTKASIRENRV